MEIYNENDAKNYNRNIEASLEQIERFKLMAFSFENYRLGFFDFRLFVGEMCTNNTYINRDTQYMRKAI